MKRAAKIIGILILILLVVAIALPFLVNVNSFRPTIESQASSALGRRRSPMIQLSVRLRSLPPRRSMSESNSCRWC